MGLSVELPNQDSSEVFLPKTLSIEVSAESYNEHRTIHQYHPQYLVL